jgi:hypothetical protein
LVGFLRLERGGDPALTRAAKHIAVAMAYDDVIRSPISDPGEPVRARPSRYPRSPINCLHHRIHASAHGGVVARCRRLGLWLEGGFTVHGAGRMIAAAAQTGTVRWFLPLYVLGGMKRAAARASQRGLPTATPGSIWRQGHRRITISRSPSSRHAGW